MEVSRRGFLGLLAGAVLGKVIGPRILAGADRAPGMAAAIRSTIPETTYLPLEVFSSRVLEIVNRELKWLRMKQSHVASNLYGTLGNVAMVRQVEAFVPLELVIEPALIRESAVSVVISERAWASMPARRMDFRMPWDKLDANFLEPVGRSLAESVIRSVRRNGGADYLVTVDQQLPDSSICRAVLAKDSENGLGLRAMQAYEPCRDEYQVEFDIMFGIADVRQPVW